MSDTLVPTRAIRVLRIANGAASSNMDRAAAEEPLEIRLHDRAFATIMRTPGRDRDLAAGFLFAERIVRDPDELGAVEHCRHPNHEEVHHVVNVFLRAHAAARLAAAFEERRRVVANSSCGVCGRATIDSLRVETDPIPAAWAVVPAVLESLPSALRARQETFDQTGGLHAAALFTRDGSVVDVAEDVGRHNAVDKLIGSAVLGERVPLSDAILMVSGRVSFEIVQKAWMAGIPLVAAISAPTSLAIDLATAAGVTLVGFLRDRTCNVYTHELRIQST